ncbi:hypothetical protein Syun_025208 [Stephania yunnanensis]|uniref:Uncharacterized protein n=1 Tax=Stephania yunnanensis TaxID=152371 RepID=A0AAP0EWS6_9MAGN
MQEKESFGKYLDSLIDFEASKQILSNAIEESIYGKNEGWMEKKLSLVGKMVLINSVALAAPIYQLSCFKVNKLFTKRVHTSISKFWWHNEVEDRKGIGESRIEKELVLLGHSGATEESKRSGLSQLGNDEFDTSSKTVLACNSPSTFPPYPLLAREIC